MKRPGLLCGAPLVLLLAWAMLPLARGGETLFLRDVANAHLEMKLAEARALAHGFFPEIDPFRAGGQPLAGNPNAVPFYPDNLLYLVRHHGLPPLWAFNAHFWIHLLLAPFAFFWLARAWGLGRGSAWAAAGCYVLSGFFLSHLSFYNLIAGAALAPAFVAACLGWADPGRGSRSAPLRLAGNRSAPLRLAGNRSARLRLALVGLLWALLLLGGDPLMAALALALAATAVGVKALARRREARPGSDALRAASSSTASSAASSSPATSSSTASAASSPASPASPVAPVSDPAPPPPARRGGGARWALGLAALVAGTLVAAPQLVEFLRILPLSFRGHWGYTAEVATVASWDPRQAAEWLLPFLFGRPDLLGPGSFWGSRFFTDVPPYYLSLYPGLLALALVAAAGLPWRLRGAAGTRLLAPALWAWGAVAAGLFVSLGRFNPLAAWLFDLPGAGSLRYPVKFWLPVAVGAALLCGIGFERVFFGMDRGTGAEPEEPGSAPVWRGEPGGEPGVPDRAARLRFGFTLGVLAGVLAAGWMVLTLLPGMALAALRRLVPASYTDAFVANERVRWAGLCLVSLAVLALVALAARWAFRQPGSAAPALVLAIHAVAQLLLLHPLYPMDAAYPYLVPPPALDLLPPGETVASGSSSALFGPSRLESGRFPEPRTLWLERRAFYELYPQSAALWGRRYALDVSPEGLDSFLTRMAQGAVKHAPDDGARLRLLTAWGVGRLLLDRPLDLPSDRPHGGPPVLQASTATGAPGARLLGEIPSFGDLLRVYAIDGRAPALYLPRRVLPAPHMNAAYSLLTDPRFRPGLDAVLPGGGPARDLGGGRVLTLRSGPESLDAEVEAAGAGWLVVGRAHLPLYRASVDDRPAAIEVANLDRLAIQVPAGRHRVRLWIDRWPLAGAVGAALVGLLGLIWLAGLARSSRFAR